MTSSSPKRPSPLPKSFHGRLKVDAQFCPTDVEDLFSTVDWEVRSSQIKGENGELIFEQTNCEVPSFWSQLATNVICSKYFYGEVGTPEREYSVRQLVHRVARTIADWGIEDGYFATPQMANASTTSSPGSASISTARSTRPSGSTSASITSTASRARSATGGGMPKPKTSSSPRTRTSIPQGSACFIQNVADDMEDIMELARSEAMLFKFGSGTGTDLSHAPLPPRKALRRRQAPRSALLHARLRPDRSVVKSGGKTRRAAKMQSLKVWHPDVMEFIECKWKEEKKAHVLIEKGGYEANFNGEAYSSIMFQNANLSVRVTDDFMQAVETNEDWTTRWVTNPSSPARPTRPARSWTAWPKAPGTAATPACSTTPRSTAGTPARTAAASMRSNPCSEYMFLDDSACNLASINLMKFRKAGWHVRRRTLPGRLPHLLHRAGNPGRPRELPDARHRPQQPPVPAARARLRQPRQPADGGRHAVRLATKVTASAARSRRMLHGAANLTSAELAEAVGPFDSFETNREPMLHVMEMHRDAVEEIDPSARDVPARCSPPRLGRSPRRRPQSTASATRRSPCWPRPARSAS